MPPSLRCAHVDPRLARRRRGLVALSVACFANAFSVAHPFAYAAFMVVFFGSVPSVREAGYYAGCLMSAFMVGQMISSYFFGYIADRYGRRLCILIGLASCTLPQLAFGLATSFEAAVAARFLMGLPNGIIVAAKALAPDLVPEREQGAVMAIISGMWGLGNLLGPVLGGLLVTGGGTAAAPAQRTPPPSSAADVDAALDTAAARPFLEQYPYALPNLIGACFACVGLVVVRAWLPATRGQLVGACAAARSAPSGALDSVGGHGDAEPTGGAVTAKAAVGPSAAGAEPSPRTAPDDDARSEGRDGGGAPDGSVAGAGSPSVAHAGLPPQESPRPAAESRKGDDDAAASLSAGLPRSDGDCGRKGGGASAEAAAGVGQRGAALPKTAWPPIVAYSLLSLTQIFFDEVYPLWCVAPTADGGLGLDAHALGALLSVSGASLLVFQLLLYPALAKRVPPSRLFRLSCGLAAALYVATPYVAFGGGAAGGAASEAAGGGLGSVGRLPLLLLHNMVLRFAMASSFTSVFIVINNSVPRALRGRAQGLSMVFASACRAAGPSLGGITFAWSLTNGMHTPPLDAHFAFVVSGTLGIGTTLFAWRRIPAAYDNGVDG